MSAMHLFPEDIISNMEPDKLDCLYQDLTAAEIINRECPKLVPALHKLQSWQKEKGVTVLEHLRIKNKVMIVIAELQLPETVEIPAVRSLWNFWGLIGELDCIPGRPLKDIIAMFQQDYPGTPEPLLSTVVCSIYEHLPLAQSAFDIRDWCHNMPRPEEDWGIAEWNMKFAAAAEAIRRKYKLPQYLE